MKTPKLSIIVAVYNVEDYLAECLDSIINQTLNDIEIICVNDGTKDNSVNILEDYQRQDPRIKIIHKENGGLSSARNAGIKIASGEYIGFVDSDDWIDAPFFERLFEAAKKHAADMAMGNTEFYFSDGKPNNKISYISKLINEIKPNVIVSADDRKKVLYTSVVWNKIFSRDLIVNNNFLFYERLLWEDSPFTIMATLKSNKIVLVRDVFYHCRIHDKSITGAANFDRKPFDVFEIMAKVKQSFDSENIQLLEGFQYLYEEIIFKFFTDHLFNRIHKKHRSEFYYRVQNEFRGLNKEGKNHLRNRFLLYNLIEKYDYWIFRILHPAYHTFANLQNYLNLRLRFLRSF